MVLSRKEFLSLPMVERRRLLEEQANNPEVIKHYEELAKCQDVCPECGGKGTMLYGKRPIQKVEHYCFTCQGTGKKADGELREKIKGILGKAEYVEENEKGNKFISAALSIQEVNDIADQILALFNEAEIRKDEREKTVAFIESYLVTTVHPEGNMHHIGEVEWQSVQQRLLRRA